MALDPEALVAKGLELEPHVGKPRGYPTWVAPVGFSPDPKGVCWRENLNKIKDKTRRVAYDPPRANHYSTRRGLDKASIQD